MMQSTGNEEKTKDICGKIQRCIIDANRRMYENRNKLFFKYLKDNKIFKKEFHTHYKTKNITTIQRSSQNQAPLGVCVPVLTE